MATASDDNGMVPIHRILEERLARLAEEGADRTKIIREIYDVMLKRLEDHDRYIKELFGERLSNMDKAILVAREEIKEQKNAHDQAHQNEHQAQITAAAQADKRQIELLTTLKEAVNERFGSHQKEHAILDSAADRERDLIKQRLEEITKRAETDREEARKRVDSLERSVMERLDAMDKATRELAAEAAKETRAAFKPLERREVQMGTVIGVAVGGVSFLVSIIILMNMLTGG